MNDDALADLAEELVTRPFPDGPAHDSSSLDGSTQSGPEAHFVPIAMQESLYETPADYDGSIGELYDDVYDEFEQRRLRAAAVLAARWGSPQPYSFQAELERVMANDDSVSMLDYDLALFTSGEQFPAWRRGDRIVGLLLGQMDKEFPIVLTLAVIARPPS
ncbi:hypothetical protein Drose_05140 [Dactylosporangium roseum]|uniref:Uncharacterized protein n=1 Tax=Dactylosporangium roseum TaxID=47989 RepID=A0ABY5Z6L2_9ACTN|nr:hypothetical protein [Dactylosporangium roseum]UWZ37661.1 hypothetical protein Drose_05140 [Dactylosporangium roseum]